MAASARRAALRAVVNFVPDSVNSPRGPVAVSKLRARGTLEPGAAAGSTPLNTRKTSERVASSLGMQRFTAERNESSSDSATMSAASQFPDSGA
jgi:hypothetical protein